MATNKNAKDMQKAAKDFAAFWAGRGDEKQDAQNFWRQLLQKVYGLESPEEEVSFEYRVKNDQTGTTIFIDAYIHDTKVLVEQKGIDIDLKKGYRQSDGSMLTPYQQARRYAGLLPHDMNPRWIVVCNFKEFHIHNMNQPNADPEIVQLADLEREYHRLGFLVDTGSENIKREMEISFKAGEIVGRLYDALYRQYIDPESERAQKSLNMLCVRLVFCFYAEDAGVFGKHLMFHDYLNHFEARHLRNALKDLFQVLNQTEAERDPYLEPELAAFPYVNGGLFADDSIEIPQMNDEIRDLILQNASEDFDWSEISPTIFGAVFESTLNPETRRKGGMHYTSIENIHKVIDPLFLDDLTQELETIKGMQQLNARNRALDQFCVKLAGLRFLDPACGSGNFLTETYLSLRRLENEAIALRNQDQIMFSAEQPIRVSISNFYGIEINDFAVTVAKTALWIAESQMMKQTEEIIHSHLDFLPLTTNAGIVEGNALRMDWNDVVPKAQLDYIMGNPPFVGARMMSAAQKEDVLSVFAGVRGNGNLDYVSCWYQKATEYMKETSVRTALVSTNSITQGEQVAILWKHLFQQGIHIDYAYRTFRWDSEASAKAHVHCVIVGFSVAPNSKEKKLFDGSLVRTVSNINGYLIEAEDVFVENQSSPICSGAPKARSGNKPIDNGYYLFTKEEKDEFIKIEPKSSEWFRPWIGSYEFINRVPRYCLWLGDCPPNILRTMPECMKRVQAVKEFRLNSKSSGTVKLAEKPTRFHVETILDNPFLVMPLTSSERRRYVPIGFITPDYLASNLVVVVADATMYDFGVLTSNVFMAWMRAVCGRLKSDYRITKDNVYNNFPWPEPTDAQKAKIEQTAQAILDARALYPDSSLADLYDELTMPPELRTAHQKNDRAVMEAYGFDIKTTTESSCVAELMKRYQALTAQKA